MNLNDLRTVLADRAEAATDTSVDARITGALTRARSIRRRRRATTAIGVAVVAAAIVAVPTLLPTPDPQPQPAIELDENGFPHVLDGYELLGSAALEDGAESLALTVTPTAFPLRLIYECPPGRTATVVIDEETSSGGGCNGAYFASEDAWLDSGFSAGEPATFTMTTDSRAGERAALAVYQAVAPLPDDPPAGTGLALETQLGDMRLLGSAVVEPPDQTTSLTVTPTEPVVLNVQTDCEHDEGPLSDAPLVELSIDGTVFAVGYCSAGIGGNENFWQELGVKAGEPVTFDLTITANPSPVVMGVYEPGVYRD